MFRLSSGDVAGFKLLFSIAIMYGIMSMVAYYVMHMKFITPLPIDAPLDRFSEARAIEHIRVLAHEIDGRQVGRQGLHDAAKYIRMQLEILKDRAGSDVRIEIEENIVNGSFNMMFLGHSLSLGYRNHTNIVMRVSSLESKDTDPSVLLNGHYDSPPGSPGAGDCGSCVASILEVARLTIDSGWAPPKPLIFLFNGAEELFMLGSHGFITTHKWRNTIGAFINLEASGTGGLDRVCQSGPGSWPSQVYAQSAVYPMGNSAAQDIFAFVPGDTDYRMFATDFGSVPGLDIIFLHGGYFYHTSTDTVERLLPGSIQARGDNLFNLLKAFTNSSKLENAHDRGLNRGSGTSDDGQPMFFDYLSLFMVYYSRRQGLVFHSIPVAIFLLVPFFLRLSKYGLLCSFAALFDFIKGTLFHVIGVIFAVIFPVVFSILRLLFSGQSMNWFARPYLAYMMFVPCSLAGMLIPRIYWNSFPLSEAGYHPKSSKEELVDQARFWGAFGLYAFISMAYFYAGLSGGFLTLSLAAFMLPAWISFHLSVKYYGHESLKSAACFLLPLLPCLLHSVYFSGHSAQFLIEKLGMAGSLPLPHGYFIPDVLVAATIGAFTSVCVGPILPVTGHWLARSSIMQFLLHTSVIALALTSQFFPYSTDAPKRVVIQHTVFTSDGGKIDDTRYDMSVVDSNALPFLFKHAPEVAKELNVDSEYSFDTANQSSREAWMAIYPLSSLFSISLNFPARRDEISKHYKYFPIISSTKQETTSVDGSRRIYLEFSLGSLKEVWVAVLNITGPISGWSFADGTLPAPEIVKGGPPSYICRLSGVAQENWTFWLETNSPGAIHIEVGVVEQYLMESMKKLKDSVPKWVDVTAYSSFLSTYNF
ncbi:endoplasmic reticulum metallopeptidase 1-like [Cynara cardunculus var. scolymus]|uniref:endoplasmic reticulum metallopeptidase 1-like n=1 Tax=Cynara cardunculus var. scolymus TaxID=59895 RepID=UPI000D62B023|nr:endoplasmic reticulum metallopeptidase 1-like [Cynara cardunculus var. scolymus]